MGAKWAWACKFLSLLPASCSRRRRRVFYVRALMATYLRRCESGRKRRSSVRQIRAHNHRVGQRVRLKLRLSVLRLRLHLELAKVLPARLAHLADRRRTLRAAEGLLGRLEQLVRLARHLELRLALAKRPGGFRIAQVRAVHLIVRLLALGRALAVDLTVTVVQVVARLSNVERRLRVVAVVVAVVVLLMDRLLVAIVVCLQVWFHLVKRRLRSLKVCQRLAGGKVALLGGRSSSGVHCARLRVVARTRLLRLTLRPTLEGAEGLLVGVGAELELTRLLLLAVIVGGGGLAEFARLRVRRL